MSVIAPMYIPDPDRKDTVRTIQVGLHRTNAVRTDLLSLTPRRLQHALVESCLAAPSALRLPGSQDCKETPLAL
jgi:hypothetical protein